MRHISKLIGDTIAISDQLNAQLDSFKNTLLSLYSQRTNISAQREADRFQYTTNIKARFQSLSSAIQAQMTMADVSTQELTLALLQYLLAGIPMVTFSGADAPGFGGNVNNFGGVYNLGYLSPTADWLQNPFYGDAGGDPGYKLVASVVIGGSYPVETLMNLYFLGSNVAITDQGGQVLPFSFPYTADWVAHYLALYQPNNQGIISAFDQANALLTGTYSGDNLFNVISDARAKLGDILQDTISVVSLELQIDQTESDLNNFVTDNQSYFSETPDQILADLKTQSETPVPVPTTDDASSEAVQAPAAAPQSSSLPLILAAGVAALAFFKKG